MVAFTTSAKRNLKKLKFSRYIVNEEKKFSLFQTNASFICPHKTEEQRISGVFKGIERVHRPKMAKEKLRYF